MVGNHEFAKRLGATIADTAGIKLRTEILFLKPDQIEPDPDQPRQEFGAAGLARLAESLRKYGQLQPVLVRKEGTKYILVAGERRWRAASLAGMATLQTLVCRGGDVRSLQLIENLLREDLKPVEQAKAFDAIMTKEGWSARELARQLHLEHSGITRALKLLELPKNVQAAVDSGKIPPTTAYEISKRPKTEHQQLARGVISGKLKGDDLRNKTAPALTAPAHTAPAPAAAPKQTLVLGAAPPSPQPWSHRRGKGEIHASGYRDRKDLIALLESALASVRSSRLPLLGGLGH